jgi:hypothetical protein
MATADILAGDNLSKDSISRDPPAFPRWLRASLRHRARRVSHGNPNLRRRKTQEAFDAWNAGAFRFARMLMESTIEMEPFREKIRILAVLE